MCLNGPICWKLFQENFLPASPSREHFLKNLSLVLSTSISFYFFLFQLFQVVEGLRTIGTNYFQFLLTSHLKSTVYFWEANCLEMFPGSLAEVSTHISLGQKEYSCPDIPFEFIAGILAAPCCWSGPLGYPAPCSQYPDSMSGPISSPHINTCLWRISCSHGTQAWGFVLNVWCFPDPGFPATVRSYSYSLESLHLRSLAGIS